MHGSLQCFIPSSKSCQCSLWPVEVAWRCACVLTPALQEKSISCLVRGSERLPHAAAGELCYSFPSGHIGHR
eukprot:2480526-Alexandrium_andersonii.AAC.1